MIINNSYLSLFTAYKCTLGDVFTVDYLEKPKACFYELFHNIPVSLEKQHLDITIVISFDSYFYERNKSNFVLLTKDEINWYFNELSKVVDFQYTISDLKNTPISHLQIIADGNYNELRWLLTCVRYIYEAPFNYAIKDAVVLKRAKKFVNINVLNVFNIIGYTISNNSSWNSNHTVGNANMYIHKFLSFDNLAKLMNSKILQYLENNFYENIVIQDLKTDGLFKEFDSDKYFTKLEVFKRYKEYYWSNYKKIKTLPNYIQEV